MKISLRAARRLESRINETLKGDIDTTKVFNIYQYTQTTDSAGNTTEHVRANVVNVSDAWGNAKTETERQVEERLELLSVRHRIRRAIGEANEEFDINEKVALRKLLLDKLVVVQRILTEADHNKKEFDLAAVEHKLRTLRETINRSSFSDESVTVSTIRSGYVEHLKTLKLSLTKSLEKVEDGLAGLNAGIVIALSEDDEKLLVKLELI